MTGAGSTVAAGAYGVPEMRRVRRIHFIGVGGAGMSGIAEVLLNQGYEVSGSDLADSAVTRRLAQEGVEVFVGHRAENVAGADVVVVSTAVPADNPERVAARAALIPIVPRAEMLGELMRYRHGIAVAGTHGKTTTTSLITAILSAAALDPTFVVGGLVKAAGRNAALGRGNVIVVEADESDGSFLFLKPMAAVLTNIDNDHLGQYGGDFERLKSAFAEFLRQLPFYGRAVVCIDDAAVRSILPEIQRPVITYGTAPEADFRARDVRVEDGVYRFTVERPERPPLALSLATPGRHNVLNALAAIAIAQDEGVDDAAIEQGIGTFGGVGRRFDAGWRELPDGRRFLLIDDYGHHPTEVARVIETARELRPGERILMVYQLHRYSRTRDLYDSFMQVLQDVDVLILPPVYAAGEAPIAGADARSLAAGIRQRGNLDPVLVDDLDAVPETVLQQLASGDTLITQGAGDVSRIASALLREECAMRGLTRFLERRWRELSSALLALPLTVTVIVALFLAPAPERVRVGGDFGEAQRERLVGLLADAAAPAVAARDLHGLRARLETEPWIHRALVRRRWPDQLEVAVSLVRPVGQTRDGVEVMADGSTGRAVPRDPELPLFDAPPDRLERLLTVHDALDAPLLERGVTLTVIEAVPGGVWRVTLSDGMRMLLSETDLSGQLRRVLQGYRRLADAGRVIESIDGRYPDGIAVTFRDGQDARDKKRAELLALSKSG